MKKTVAFIAVLTLVCAVAFAANLVKFGDMETGTASDWMEEGSSLKLEAGKGIGPLDNGHLGVALPGRVCHDVVLHAAAERSLADGGIGRKGGQILGWHNS